ncbi:hypothetical protein QOZ80_4BG0354280 [Eleusine coracana subsp. coracana]|nr:hypothetical protein QOZ80_4BG0354280 [Eleusine coracana subsp. coracana]
MGLDGIGRSSWKSSVTYWSSGKWNSRFRFFGSIPEISGPTICNFTFVNNDQEVYYMYTLWDDNIIVQDLLDVSGQRISRIWNSHDWVTFSYEPKYQCDVYAVCGPYTICSNNANPVCDCMKGFSVRSPKDWELGDRTSGCIRNTPLDCSNHDDKNETGMIDKFYSIQSVRLPQNSVGIPHAASATECAQVCLNDCSCTAHSYDKGGCSIWHDELINVAAKDNGEVLYLRLAAKEVQTQKSNRRGMIIRVTCGAIIALLVFIFLLVIWRMRKGKMDDHGGGAGIIAFRYTYLQRATKNFSNRLGGGSFGQVFKGYLSDSVNIAVKRLDGVRQGEKQFKAEVSSIGIIQHINLVKLIGFCCEGDKRLLMYQYMPNSSLDNHIFQNHGTTLGWNIKYQIALGVARGLAYLHHSCRDCIIHCDIKPENILLDASYVPKISDFGMAKFLGRDFSRVVTTMRGTIGYLAPEWISGTAITSKVDVYSYGMVLLELISGSRNFNTEKSSNGDQANYFPVKVAHKLRDGNIASLVDAKLHDSVNMEEFERVCKVACWCIQDNELDRPTMAEVVQFLEHIFEPGMPPVPRFLHAITGGSHTM